LQDHRLSTVQNIVPETTGCDRNEAERQDRGEIRSKAEAKRPQWRLTDEQSRDIISHREGLEPTSYRAIAKALGCSKSTAWRHKRKHLRQKRMMEKEDSQ
jgi:DNA invertase Pin-like site-specific DNA recombinase